MTPPNWFARADRRWRAVRETPLALLASALVQRDGIYGQLLDLGWSSTDPEHASTLTACGFDNQNGWHWLDVAVAPASTEAWLDPKKQRRVRALLDTRIVYFRPKDDDLFRVWWKSPSNKGVRLAKKS